MPRASPALNGCSLLADFQPPVHGCYGFTLHFAYITDFLFFIRDILGRASYSVVYLSRVKS